MLRLERRGKAFEALLRLAEKGSIQISSRGINGEGRSLFELTTHKGEVISLNQTEEQITKRLLEE